jgi:hypothetical protein
MISERIIDGRRAIIAVNVHIGPRSFAEGRIRL